MNVGVGKRTIIHTYTGQLPRSERERIQCRIQQDKTNTSHPSFANSISPLQQFISDTIPLSNERSLKLVFFDTMPDSFPPHCINTEAFSNSGNTTL